MLKIDKNNNISMTRGDEIELQINVFFEDGTQYVITADDVVTFTVRKYPKKIKMMFRF